MSREQEQEMGLRRVAGEVYMSKEVLRFYPPAKGSPEDCKLDNDHLRPTPAS